MQLTCQPEEERAGVPAGSRHTDASVHARRPSSSSPASSPSPCTLYPSQEVSKQKCQSVKDQRSTFKYLNSSRSSPRSSPRRQSRSRGSSPRRRCSLTWGNTSLTDICQKSVCPERTMRHTSCPSTPDMMSGYGTPTRLKSCTLNRNACSPETIYSRCVASVQANK